ncbi:hypothetical protein ACFYO2_31795 [Streptomyces sp. NPDC006602]|uniref:hypothetical protein n=1 Tax=Streptomyces sp. NPDC006602 TaxID=3364751 RepID=UPI0036C5E6AE
MSDAHAGTREGAVAPAPSADLLERVRRHRRHTLELLTVCAIGLVPWTVLLAFTLPSGYEVHQWRVTWVGFDVLLVVAMASTVILGWLRHRFVIVSGLATAVLLICDAWFDVSLAFGTSDVWLSAALAVFAELPLAGYLIHRVMGMISLAQWPSAETTADSDGQAAGPDA